MAALNNPRFIAGLLESLEYFYKNPRLHQTYIKVDNYSVPITKKGAIKLLHSRINWIKGKPLESDQDYDSLFKLLHERIFIKNNYKIMIPLVTKEVTGHALDSNPTPEQTDVELNQISDLPQNEQHQAFEKWAEKQSSNKEGNQVTSHNPPPSSSPPVTERFADVGQALPANTPPPSDMEVIHATEEPSTSRNATVPTEAINKARSILTNKEFTEPASRIARNVLSEGEITFKTQTQPWVFRNVKSFGNTILDEMPLFSSSRSIRGSRGLARSGFSAARKGSTAIRAGSLVARGAPLVAAAAPEFAIIIAIIVIVLLLFFMIFQHGLQNTALCPPWEGCPQSASGALGAPPQNLLIIKEGPPEGKVPNDTAITYKITVSYKGTGTAKVDLMDKIPADTKFSSASPVDSGIFERKNENTPDETLIWHLKDLKYNQAQQVTFTVMPIPPKKDFWAINQATANATITGGVGTAQGLLCAADVDPRLIPMFEQAGIAANVSPVLMYAVAKGEKMDARATIAANSLDGKPPIISLTCGAHGIMQIEHPNDGTTGAPQKYINACPNPPEEWDPLVRDYNEAAGGRLRDVDADEDNIWGSAFFLRHRKLDHYAFKAKGWQDKYEDNEIVQVSIGYLGGYDPAYANFYLNAYHEALAAQGTCGSGNNGGASGSNDQ